MIEVTRKLAAGVAAAGLVMGAAHTASSAVDPKGPVCPGLIPIPPITEENAAVDDIPTLPIGAGNKVLATNIPDDWPEFELPEPDIDPAPFQG